MPNQPPSNISHSDLLGINQTGMSYGFSRANITSSVVLPAKAVYRPGASREEIISYHEEQGLMPRPFAPFSFALNAAHGSSSSMSSTLQGSSAHSKGGSTLDGSGDNFMVEGKGRISIDKRVSTQSFSASAARLHPVHKRNSSMFSAIRDSIRDSFFGLGVPNRPGSVMSAVSNSSSQLSTGGVQTRRVHQIFTPILPDEPTLAVGERVAVLRSFDDGWCVIGRDKLFGQPGDVELGTVPAWCFVKPMKGLKSERPVRSSSLGVTVQVDLDGPQKPRDDIISWSNF